MKVFRLGVELVGWITTILCVLGALGVGDFVMTYKL